MTDYREEPTGGVGCRITAKGGKRHPGRPKKAYLVMPSHGRHSRHRSGRRGRCLPTAQELLAQNGTMASAWCGVSTVLLTASAALERILRPRQDRNAGRPCSCGGHCGRGAANLET
ncbi:hypothetical protein GCM10023323_66910 [Streptomyces thinghirensis]|uniref:Uncharacterized protein n=1 Tax=Streptomyces thinghirensis TaxID=551547 RepID=A0ABP9TC71_9ACTN